MNNISDKLSNFYNLLESAIEDHNWDLVREVMDDIDCLYQDLERGVDGFEAEY